MSGRFSTYEPPETQRFSTVLNIGNGAANREDELFLNKLLSTFVNKQSSLFSKWIKVRITEYNNNAYGRHEFKKYINNNSSSFGSKQPKSQLLVLTPLRIISLPNVDSPKRMKQFRIIDIVSLFVEENNNYTNWNNPIGINQYLNVSQGINGRERSLSSKRKLNKPRTKKFTKHSITNNQPSTIKILQNHVNNPSTLLYPKGQKTTTKSKSIKKKNNNNKRKSKILQS